MKIESLIQRSNGTKVDMEAPERTYHFKPSAEDPRHIAEVDVDHHAKTLLRITEGYRAVDADDLPFGDDEPLGRQLNGSNVHNSTYVIKGGDTIELQELVNMAFDDSGLDEAAWNALDDEDRYEYINTTLNELIDGEHIGNEEATAQTQEPAAELNNPVVDTPAEDAAETDGDNYADDAPQPVDAATTPVVNDQYGDGINDDIENLKGNALVAAYEAKFGRKPSSKMRVDDIRRALSEDDE